MRKGWKRVHRMVVLPDYQGIGIGIKFINEVSKHYFEDGLNMNLTTTTPAFVGGLRRSDKWSLVRVGRMKSSFASFNKYGTGVTKFRTDLADKASSKNRITYSFNFKK